MTRPAEDSAPNPEDVAQRAELLVRTSRRLRRSSMAELGPMGLTGAQARVILYLVAVGHPARMADIAAALEVVPRTATSVVDDLEAAASRIPAGAVPAFLARLARAAQLLEANANPELVVDVLVLAWPRAA